MLLALLAIDRANQAFTDSFNHQAWDQLQAGYSNTSVILWGDQFEQSPYQSMWYQGWYHDGVRTINRTANRIEVTPTFIHEIGTVTLYANRTMECQYYTKWNANTLLRDIEVQPWRPQAVLKDTDPVPHPRLAQFTYLYNRQSFDRLTRTLFTADATIVTPHKFIHPPDFVAFFQNWDSKVNMTSLQTLGTQPVHQLGQRSRDHLYYALWRYNHSEWKISLFIPYI